MWIIDFFKFILANLKDILLLGTIAVLFIFTDVITTFIRSMKRAIQQALTPLGLTVLIVIAILAIVLYSKLGI